MPYIFKDIIVDDENARLEASSLGLTLEEFVKKFGLEKIQNTTDPVGKKTDPSEKDANAGQEVEVTASDSENGLLESPGKDRYIKFKSGKIVYEDDYLKNFAGTENYPETFDEYAKAFGTKPKSFDEDVKPVYITGETFKYDISAPVDDEFYNLETDEAVKQLDVKFKGSGIYIQDNVEAAVATKERGEVSNSLIKLKIKDPKTDKIYESKTIIYNTTDENIIKENNKIIKDFTEEHKGILDDRSFQITQAKIANKYNELQEDIINPELNKRLEADKQKYLIDPGLFDSYTESSYEYTKEGGRRFIKTISPYSEEIQAEVENILNIYKANNQSISNEEATELAKKNVREDLFNAAKNEKLREINKEIIENTYSNNFKLFSGKGKEAEKKAQAFIYQGGYIARQREDVKVQEADELLKISEKQIEKNNSIYDKYTTTIPSESEIKSDLSSLGLDYIENPRNVELKNGDILDENVYNILLKSSENINSQFRLSRDAYGKKIKALGEIKDLNLAIDAASKNYDLHEKYLANVGVGFLDIGAGLGYLGGKLIALPLYSGNPIDKFLDESAVEYSKYSQEVRDSYVRDVSLEESFDSASNFGKFWIQETSNQIPILLTMAASGGAGSVVIGASSMGGKMMDMQYEMATGKAEYSGLEFWLKSFGYGLAEGVFSELTTMPILKRAKANWKLKGGNDLLDNSTSEYVKSRGEMILADSLLEPAGEIPTQIAQNLLDGVDPLENVDHAGVSGFGMSLIMSGIPFLKGAYTSRFSTYENYENVRKLQNEIKELSIKYNEIGDRRFTPAKLLAKNIKSKQLQIQEAILKAENIVNNNLTATHAKRVISLNKELANLQNQAKEIQQDKTLDNKTKQKLLNDLKVDFDKKNAAKQYSLSEENMQRYAPEFALLEESDPTRYNNLIKEAKFKLEGEYTLELAKEQAYELYLREEIISRAKKAGKVKGANLEIIETIEEAVEKHGETVRKNDKDPYIELENGDVVFKSQTETKKYPKTFDQYVEESSSKPKSADYDTLSKGGIDGFKIGDKQVVVVEAAVRNQVKEIGTHEVSHYVTDKLFEGNEKAYIPIARDLMRVLYSVDKKLHDRVIKLAEKDANGNPLAHEVIARFIEMVAESKADYVENKKIKGLAGLFGVLTQTQFSSKYNFNFKGETDIYNFVVGLGKKIASGEVDLVSQAGEGILIKEYIEKAEKEGVDETETKDKKSLSDLRRQRDELDIFDFDDPNEFDSALANIERKIKIAEKKEKEAKAKPAVEKPRKKADEKQLGDQFKEMVPPGTSNSEYRKNIAPKVIRAIEDDRMLFPLVRKIASGYGIVADNVYGQSFDDFYNAAISVQFKNNILNFKPESNDDLGGYIIGGQAGIRNRVKEALEKFKKEQSKTVEDIGQAIDITADEATGPKQETRKKYKSLINSNTIPNFTVEEIKTKLLDKISSLKSKITDVAGDNAAMTPLIKEIKSKIAKVAGDKEAIPKLVRKRMGGTYKRGMESGVYKNFLLKNKKAIIQNMPTTWLMGKDKKTSVSGGFPLAIEKSVGGEYTGEFETVNIAGVEAKYEIFKPNYVPYPKWVGEKIDREGGAKRGITSGNQLVRRISESKIDNMSDEAFLDNFIIEGDNKKGQDIFESLSLALGEELSFEIISKELKNPNSEISKVFENNQQALGVVIKDNIAQEFSRQAERGLVKFSISQKDSKSLIDAMIEEGILSEKARKIALDARLSDVEYERLKESVIHEGILASMQDLITSNKGIKYEKALFTVLNKFSDKKISVNFRKERKGDLNIQIGTNKYTVEVKLNEKAQIGSASVGLFKITSDGVIKLKNKSNLLLSKDLSKENLELFNNFLNEEKTKKYFKNLVDAINKANSKSKNLKVTINKSGHLKLPYKDFWENIKNEMPRKIAGYVSYIGDESIVEDFYKDVDLIQIGGYGAYYISEKSKLKAYYNKLKAETINTLRPVRSGETVYIRLFPSFKTIKSKKADSLDTSKGIEKLSNISLEASNYDDIQKGQKAINNAIKNSYSQNPKGISVWDFDDTLARTKSNVLYTMPDGTKGKLDAAQFAARSEELADMGAKFDFSEFSKVMKGEKGPMFDKAIDRNKKFGNENVYILTARPADSKFAIHEFLKGIGLDIKLDNIVGLADGNPQAKANWMIGKVAEGYNDFYFADDHIGNVKAVKEVLDTFDVKGKVQQAKVKFSKSLNTRFNEILERKTGVNAFKEYSNMAAKRAGRKKGRFKIWMPSSLDDFKGLTSYTFAGKGKQGEEDQKFFQDALITPYFRGIQAINTKKQRLKEDFRKLNKMYRPIMKKLGKLIPSGDYTHDQAIRVYLWNKSGYEIPGIPEKDLKRLVNFVEGDSDILTYANMLQRIAKRKNWVKPSAYWDAETILSDLNNITEKVGRKEYLQEFIENADIIFSEKNLNKIEATFGTSHRDALEDILYRMKNGTNRRFGSNKLENRFNTWVNNSIGAIMFFNRRSALLQTLSTVNFINWSDNNIAKAALAFANQPQYWKDFATIFNSDKLKQRRSGLKSDVNEAEIASAVKGARNKATAALSYLLKIGFTPTQIVDSFAIASGGATFYRNRINTYLKKVDSDGEKVYTQKEAEEKAWEDFSEISEETQQSGDPALISMQQASSIGRLILAFQNTPIQLNRSIKKAALDIKNRRRAPGLSMAQSDLANVSKIIYYGAIQNIIFTSLQNALFALIPGFDDDEDLTEEEQQEKYGKVITTKQERIINNISDTILKGGFGWLGAVVSTIKNTGLEYLKQEEKTDFLKDHTYTVIQALNISPPVGSKIRKLYSGIQTADFEEDVIEARGWDVTIDGKFNLSPSYRVLGSVTEAATNIPLERVANEIESITEAFDSRNTAMQRIALALGWKTWDVSAKNEEHDLIKTQAKAKRKEEGIKKAKATRKKISDNKKKYKKEYKNLNFYKQYLDLDIEKERKDRARKQVDKSQKIIDSIVQEMKMMEYILENNKFVKIK